jgi:hypothetical protein
MQQHATAMYPHAAKQQPDNTQLSLRIQSIHSPRSSELAAAEPSFHY